MFIVYTGCGSKISSSTNEKESQDERQTTAYRKIKPNTVSFEVVDWIENGVEACCADWDEGDLLFTRNFSLENSEISIYIPPFTLEKSTGKLSHIKFSVKAKKNSPEQENLNIDYSLTGSNYSPRNYFRYHSPLLHGNEYSCSEIDCRYGVEFIVSHSCNNFVHNGVQEDINIEGLQIGDNYYEKRYSIDCSDGGERLLVYFSYRMIPVEGLMYAWLKNGLIVISDPPFYCGTNSKNAYCYLNDSSLASHSIYYYAGDSNELSPYYNINDIIYYSNRQQYPW